MKTILITFGFAGLLIAACGDEAEPVPVSVDALVIVQETNLTSCALPFSHDLEVTRDCDGSRVDVAVCSEQALCAAQLEALTLGLTDCSEEREQFEASTTVSCD